MYRFHLVNGKVKILTHAVSYERMTPMRDEETKEVQYTFDRVESRDFYSAEDKDTYLGRLEEMKEKLPYEIDPQVTEYPAPSQELFDRVEGKKFNTIAEAKAFIADELPLSETDTLALAIAEIYEMIIGGAE
ncbi:MAG: hypothetical protein GX800_12235 [Clostridiaceae bacterium]|nr:hypothetical protein [Clostridiaceae bacterium]